MQRIAMIGFGEAARAFTSGWRTGATVIAAHDLKADDPAMLQAAKAAGIACHAGPEAALTGAGIAFCLVTADQALTAAEAAAVALPPGLLWLDGNSCAPGTKRRAAKVIEAAGGRYVDMAIMAPVHPRLHRTPALLAGPHAEAALAALEPLEMASKIAGARVGDASAIKMLRSVMIKGLEALSAECLLAARRAGVEEAVLASLQDSDPGWDWTARSAYNLERMMAHGSRRAAEMREVAATLRELGLPDRMATATAAWQEEIAALSLPGGPDALADRADRILSRL
ncbi:3-hydroxyisobutyrate dehydrogenase [Paracoccus pantotrophus]|nr:3-hydroxyisobutyrate dehydrogenase [Paracoccus pantotrophus]